MSRLLKVMLLSCAFVAAPSWAAEVGRVKTVTGVVHIERSGQRLPAAVDTALRASDTVVTGPASSVGITFADESRIAAGPNSTLVIDKYVFDSTTHAGTMETTLKRGMLAIVSGRMVKQSPQAATVRTPFLVLGIRGTEFVVSAE